MIKIAAYLLAGIGIGAAFAFWQSGTEPIGGSTLGGEESGSVERRLSELETELALERYEREALKDEIDALRMELVPGSRLASDDDDRIDEGRDRLAALGDDGQDDRPRAEERQRERFGGFASREEFLTQRQLDRYVEAGFSIGRAQRIMQREEELQMEVLQARYEATQAGASAAEVARLEVATLLREELGDDDYAKYLEARGRPASVRVGEVLLNSPAQTAGLREGDEIVAYNGKRVFDMNELNALTHEGRPGESVVMEILRDGAPMQVFVTRGPIGISGGGRSPGRR